MILHCKPCSRVVMNLSLVETALYLLQTSKYKDRTFYEMTGGWCDWCTIFVVQNISTQKQCAGTLVWFYTIPLLRSVQSLLGHCSFKERSDSVVTDSRTLMAFSSTHQTHQTQSWSDSYGLLSSCSTASPESSSDITSVASSSTSSSFTASCSSFSLQIQKYTKG